jgi:peptide/nickel transport system substrate-binding protein
VLVKNPNWQGEPEPFFERVILKAVPESSARLSLLKAGQIDIAWGLNERELREVATDPNLQVVRAQSNKQLYIGLVTDKPPFDNKAQLR